MALQTRTIILISAALITALSAVVVRNRLNAVQAPVAEKIDSNRVLVALRDLSPGRFIDSVADLEWKDVDEKTLEGDVIREGTVKRSEFNGAVIRKNVKAGKPVAPDEITRSGDGGFLSAVLEPGMRAVSIAVNATTGAAGFIAPGDKVDLIVTHRVKTSDSESSNKNDTVVSETFVQNVRVVAVDQSLDSPENKAQLAKNVTVEVNENQAEQITVANEMGKISMALRSALPDDPNMKKVVSGQYTSDKDVSGVMGNKVNIVPRVQVFRGEQKEELQFLQQESR